MFAPCSDRKKSGGPAHRRASIRSLKPLILAAFLDLRGDGSLSGCASAGLHVTHHGLRILRYLLLELRMSVQIVAQFGMAFEILLVRNQRRILGKLLSDERMPAQELAEIGHLGPPHILLVPAVFMPVEPFLAPH